MPSIASLPNELIAFVLENLPSQKDIASLCRVNRKLNEAVSPILYKNAVDRRDLWPLAFASFSGNASTMRKILAAGADANSIFDSSNIPRECFPLIIPEPQRLPRPPNAPCGHSQGSQSYSGLHDYSNPWSPSTADSQHYYDDEDDEDDQSMGGDLDVWGTWAALPFDPYGDVTPSVVHGDALDEGGPSDHSSEGSDADSSTLGNSDRNRDGVVYRYMGHYPASRFFTALHVAAATGNNQVIEVLLEFGALINSSSRSLCFCQRASGILNSLESPETEDRPPLWTPLHVAICHNRPETAMLLLSHGADCMMESLYEHAVGEQYDSTALHYAAALGQAELVKYLVEKGHQKEIDIRDRRTLTPFYYAYANGRWDSTVPLLLQMGADINVEIKFYQPYCSITPLGEAVRLGNFDDAQRLIDLGADPGHGFVATGAGHRKGLSPLHLACMPSAQPSGGHAFLEEGDKATARMRIMQTFIAKGSDIHGTNCYGDTPLISAAQNRVLPALRALIAAGADVNARNSLGRTVTMQAVLGPPNPLPGPPGDDPCRIRETVRILSDILSELFKAGARLLDVDPQGNTILHLLLDNKLDRFFISDVVRLLLNDTAANSLLEIRNNEGQLAFQVAFHSRLAEACAILLRRGSVQRILTANDLHAMFRFAHMDLSPLYLDMLLDLDFDRVLLSNPSLFTECVTNGFWSAASAIALRGIPPLSRATCTELLRRALIACKWEIAYQLIERGADVNAVGKDDMMTPLNLVIDQLDDVEPGRIEKLVRILMDRGADIHYSPSGTFHCRPLNEAIACGAQSLVEVMLRAQPLRNDPRAAGGFYLHKALRLIPPPPAMKRSAQHRIVYSLIHSGADLTEVDENGDYPLTVLLRVLCTLVADAPPYDFQFLYGTLLKDLFVPGVRITEPNNQGQSIVDYLEEILKSKAGMKFFGPKIDLAEGAGGAKVLKFRPDMKLKRMPEDHPVTTIWESQFGWGLWT